MARTLGAKNVTPFGVRKSIGTTDSTVILHISDYDSSPLEHFKQIINSQNNFSSYMKNSHDQLKKMKNEENARRGLVGKEALAVKGKPYNKYNWYIQQLFLLELINGYEVFYKRSIVRLAEIIKHYQNPESLKGEVDVKVLWHANSTTSLISLVFEKMLFHNLSSVDDAKNMLVGKKRYQPANKKTALYGDVIKKIQAIFQVRHTLSHNSGYVTESDAAKLKILGYEISQSQVIDPTEGKLGLSIARFLRVEAEEFTVWLRQAAKEYLNGSGQKISVDERDKLKSNFGGDDAFWSEIVT